MSDKPYKLAFIDVETTGLDPRVHVPWEIAVIVRQPSLDDDEWVWQVRPSKEQLRNADPDSMRIGRYRERFNVPDGWDASRPDPYGPPFKLKSLAAMLEIQDVLRGACLVAANPHFDLSMLEAVFRQRELRTVWHYRPCCVESMVQAACRLKYPPSLREASKLMGVPYDPDRAHSALPDARLVRDVYDKLIGKE